MMALLPRMIPGSNRSSSSFMIARRLLCHCCTPEKRTRIFLPTKNHSQPHAARRFRSSYINGRSAAPAASNTEIRRDDESFRVPTTATAATTNGSSACANNNSAGFASVRGETLDLAADLRTFRPGDKLEIPYETTVSESMQDFWQSAFHAQDRIHTSRPFCRKMGLQDRVLPFSLALFLCSSMTHEDAARIHVGYGPVKYTWPCFAGDTFTKTFTVESIRNTSDGKHSLIQFQCDLINQRGRLCMRADKRMLFEFSVPGMMISPTTNPRNHPPHPEQQVVLTPTADPPNGGHLFRDHLLSKSHVLSGLSSHSLADLRPGQLILHSLQRCLTFTQSQQLASLARLTHEKHFDRRKYGGADGGGDDDDEHDNSTTKDKKKSLLLVPGGLVLGLTMNASARDFHEGLHEELLNVNYVNALHPGNMVGAISYIQKVEDVGGAADLQMVTVRTLGIKNLDVVQELDGIDLPLELMEWGTTSSSTSAAAAAAAAAASTQRNGTGGGRGGTGGSGIQAKTIQQICKSHCPQLYNKIIVQMDRRILRQAPRQHVFLL